MKQEDTKLLPTGASCKQVVLSRGRLDPIWLPHKPDALRGTFGALRGSKNALAASCSALRGSEYQYMHKLVSAPLLVVFSIAPSLAGSNCTGPPTVDFLPLCLTAHRTFLFSAPASYESTTRRATSFASCSITNIWTCRLQRIPAAGASQTSAKVSLQLISHNCTFSVDTLSASPSRGSAVLRQLPSGQLVPSHAAHLQSSFAVLYYLIFYQYLAFNSQDILDRTSQ